MNRLAVYSTIHLQFSFFAILKVGSLSKYFSLDQGVWITAFTTGLKIKSLKYWSRVIRFGLSESFTDVLECCQASTWSVLPEIMDWGNPLNKSPVPNITSKITSKYYNYKIALVSCNQSSPCIMTTVLPSTRGDRDECVCACVYAQLCLTPCDPMDCSPPDSSVHEISQARILEWVSISFSRGSSWPRDGTCVSWGSCTGRWILYHCATWEAQRQISLFLKG